MHNIIVIIKRVHFGMDWTQHSEFYAQNSCSRKIGKFSGRYKFRNRPWSKRFWPTVRGTSSAQVTRHIEQNIVDYLRRASPSIIAKLGKGLTIDLATNNDAISTTRPCNTCTPMLKKTVPSATIIYKERGVTVRQKVQNLDSALAIPTSGAKLRSRASGRL